MKNYHKVLKYLKTVDRNTLKELVNNGVNRAFLKNAGFKTNDDERLFRNVDLFVDWMFEEEKPKTKKVFSCKKYFEDMADTYTVEKRLKNILSWGLECEGKTIEECAHKMFTVLPVWCVEVPDV